MKKIFFILLFFGSCMAVFAQDSTRQNTTRKVYFDDVDPSFFGVHKVKDKIYFRTKTVYEIHDSHGNSMLFANGNTQKFVFITSQKGILRPTRDPRKFRFTHINLHAFDSLQGEDALEFKKYFEKQSDQENP